MSLLEFIIFLVRDVTSEEEEGPTGEQEGVTALESKEKEEESK